MARGLESVKNVYFIGIGGISMSGLALILKNMGLRVYGSDSKASAITETLEKSGISVFIGQKAENIASDIDLAVYTAAISEDNPELLEIGRRNIELIPRSKLLGIIMDRYENSVAVAGTHGKTTTTSMVSQLLIDAALDPTISIGGIFPLIGGNIRIGSSGCFVTEACEYTNSFLTLKPKVAVVLNIELDHIDYFKDIGEVYESFKGFVSNVSDGGAVIVNSAVEGLESLAPGKNVITFGFDEGDDWFARDITQKGGVTEFTLCHNGEPLGKTHIALPGLHNVSNTLAACAAAHFFGVPERVLLETPKKFTGTQRRFEYKGEKNGVLVYDDYAHHPSEIQATLKAARSVAKGRIFCVFQPHTYTRTKAFLSEFARSFGDADTVVLADIYAAREKDPGDINSQMLLEKLVETGAESIYFPGFGEIVNYLKENCTPGDMVITMGAGDIYAVGESFRKER